MNTEPTSQDKDDIRTYLIYIKRLCPLISEEELVKHARTVSVCKLKKKAFFMEAGEKQKDIGFITKGLIRSFYIAPDEKEGTQQFIAENSFVSHYSALLNNEPSKFNYQCLEDTTLVKIPFAAILDSYNWSHQFERFGRIIAEKICQVHHMRVESFLFETAEQRYLNFITAHPDLFNRVSISHLCSYLGVERQTLTRIRNKLSKA